MKKEKEPDKTIDWRDYLTDTEARQYLRSVRTAEEINKMPDEEKTVLLIKRALDRKKALEDAEAAFGTVSDETKNS